MPACPPTDGPGVIHSRRLEGIEDPSAGRLGLPRFMSAFVEYEQTLNDAFLKHRTVRLGGRIEF